MPFFAPQRNGAIILGYHRVGDPRIEDLTDRQLDVPAARFSKQMEILSRRFRIVPLDELVARMTQLESAAGLAAITFDDGYADNYRNALPILKRMGLPATVFLVAGCVERGRTFWTDRLASHVSQENRARGAGVRRAYVNLRSKLSAMEDGERERFLDELGAPAPENGLPLTWEQVREMRDAGFTFGAHTWSHPSLVRIGDRLLRSEIEASRDLMLARTGMSPDAFAYPFGDVDRRVAAAVEAAGFTCAVTTRNGACTARSRPLLLPRVMLADCSDGEFARRLDRFAR
jgi:peptidoglycan/xylan/chitin deacetylase (PgdA/CDA1 family)